MIKTTIIKVIKFIGKAIFVIVATFAFLFVYVKIDERRNKSKQVQEEIEETEIIEEETINPNDPLNISFNDYSYYLESDLRYYLAKTELGLCSEVTDYSIKGFSHYIFLYRLKSNGKIVYECRYMYDNKNEKESYFKCIKKEGYEDFVNGDTNMYREYIMPTENNTMLINRDRYYENYFSLGKFSDMKCELKGEDIYIDYYWYHNGEDGPILIYEASAKNTEIVSYKKYHQEIWDYYDESKDNIDIIPYDKFEREHDYVQECKEYNRQKTIKHIEENKRKEIKMYCACESADDLYDRYDIEFGEDYEEAYDFYTAYCE